LSVQKSSQLLDPLFTTGRMHDIFSDRSRLQAMLDFEATLARAEASLGVIPSKAAGAIAAQCRAELFDAEALARATAAAGNLAIPLVKELTARVAQNDKEAAGFVHWGATSQDVIDTGLVLQLRAALDATEAEVGALADSLARLAETHKRTPLAGRTLLQQALPVTFGLKVAGWLSAIERHRARLREIRPRALALQFGGAAGTLAALENRGMDVAAALSKALNLALPELPWHTQRDRVAEVATTFGLLTGTLGKIGRDIALLMQTEVGEVFEPAGADRGGSTTMPHKRNPVGSVVAQAAAQRVPALVSTMLAAMVQEHERAAGGWHAEWETLPEICRLSAGALAHIREIVNGLEIDPARMRANLDASHGLIYAEAITMVLAKHIGRAPAYQVIEKACRRALDEKRPLREVVAQDPQVKPYLPATELDRLFDPSNYFGSAVQLVERVLAQRSKPR